MPQYQTNYNNRVLSFYMVEFCTLFIFNSKKTHLYAYTYSTFGDPEIHMLRLFARACVYVCCTIFNQITPYVYLFLLRDAAIDLVLLQNTTRLILKSMDKNT